MNIITCYVGIKIGESWNKISRDDYFQLKEKKNFLVSIIDYAIFKNHLAHYIICITFLIQN